MHSWTKNLFLLLNGSSPGNQDPISHMTEVMSEMQPYGGKQNTGCIWKSISSKACKVLTTLYGALLYLIKDAGFVACIPDR